MKISRMTTLLVLLVTLMLLSLAGMAQAQDVELTITWWGSQNRHDRTIEVIELFQQQNPGISVTYEFSGWGDYWTRVNTQAAGGNVACIMQQDYAFLTEWASRDLLMPLDGLMSSGAINVSNVSESIIGSGQVGGETFGISLGTNSQTYILDADAFETAGIDLPAWDWTWDDFEAISTQFNEDLGIWGIAYGPWDDGNLKSLLISSGQWMFSDDGTAIAIEDPAPMIAHLERIHRMMDSGAIAGMDLQPEFTGSHEESPIVQGTEAMRYQWSNQVVSLYSAAGEDRNFVLYPLPRVASGVTPNYLKPSMFFAITDGCGTVPEAAMFIDFFTNNIEANDILFAERGVPVSSVVSEHLAGQVDAVSQKVFEYIAEISEIAQPVPPPDPAGYADINLNVMAPLFVEPVLFGMISAEEGYDTFLSESNAILAQNATD